MQLPRERQSLSQGITSGRGQRFQPPQQPHAFAKAFSRDRRFNGDDFRENTGQSREGHIGNGGILRHFRRGFAVGLSQAGFRCGCCYFRRGGGRGAEQRGDTRGLGFWSTIP